MTGYMTTVDSIKSTKLAHDESIISSTTILRAHRSWATGNRIFLSMWRFPPEVDETIRGATKGYLTENTHFSH